MLGEMRKGSRERIEREKRERDKNELRCQFEEEEEHHHLPLLVAMRYSSEDTSF